MAAVMKQSTATSSQAAAAEDSVQAGEARGGDWALELELEAGEEAEGEVLVGVEAAGREKRGERQAAMPGRVLSMVRD